MEEIGLWVISTTKKQLFLHYVKEVLYYCIFNIGFIRSGDLGKLDDGNLIITGRLKEILITAGGENIAPIMIGGKLYNN